jgi:hypothetical protein
VLVSIKYDLSRAWILGSISAKRLQKHQMVYKGEFRPSGGKYLQSGYKVLFNQLDAPTSQLDLFANQP